MSLKTDSTLSQRLHPFGCWKVKKKTTHLVVSCILIRRGKVLPRISCFRCLFNPDVFLIVDYSLKNPFQHTLHIL